MKRPRYLLLSLIGIVALAGALLLVAGCGSNSTSSSAGPTAGGSDVSGNVSVMAVWSGDEQKSFQQVIDGFTAMYPNITVNYNSAGDQLPTVLSTAVQGGNPPSVAVLPQPGLMQAFVKKGALVPIDYAKDTITQNYAPDWMDLGSVDGTLYGLFFKGANKSTVWYNVKAFADAGVNAPPTWPDLMTGAETLKASGVKAFSIAGADGWTLTDLFENIYLRSAGPDMYDKLTNHEIPWTDASVTSALQFMAQVFSDTGNIAGGTSGALQTDFPTSVTQVFTDPPKAAMVFEGDFVQGVITSSTSAQPTTGFNQFAFPSVGASQPSVVGGGDMVVTFNNDAATKAFVEYLATPQAAEIWAKLGGFASPNKNVNPDVYPDDISKATASALAEATTFRFDMSDLAPPAFGGTVGQGEWKILQDFLKNPKDIQSVQKALEKAAAKAYGN